MSKPKVKKIKAYMVNNISGDLFFEAGISLNRKMVLPDKMYRRFFKVTQVIITLPTKKKGLKK